MPGDASDTAAIYGALLKLLIVDRHIRDLHHRDMLSQQQVQLQAPAGPMADDGGSGGQMLPGAGGFRHAKRPLSAATSSLAPPPNGAA
ncbi:hypothetical protein CHLRE_14g615618v5 [Chlamydomonas reinhardtii]|uniref:Uncharacterized protein n=1 Tax=Chlamydomonas reinhardtii TaxID=3055 RepID=A0A2K3CXK7_CHLRE|nr:uncharacterized protein CHLRE_14g615618v5 [Chlamydomonas reinhardtii]PNW73018.1 hypothetical protein CHLRE_14g615618v5 [Chlamydomonas reinhardtii]